MSDSESSEHEEGFSFAQRHSNADDAIITDPFAIASKQKKVSYGSFSSMNLHPGLMNSIKKKGYNQPTPIQRKVIPVILSGSDMIAMARTGSGKTLAFSIPILQRLQSHSTSAGIRALVLAPTRELCMQTYKYMKDLASGSDLRVALLTGGDNLEHHFELLAANPDIVIASPGRLLHILHETSLSLSKLEMLVFDEADRLLEMGFQTEIEAIVKATPVSRQTMLFSATLPKLLVEFTRVGLKNPEMIRLDADSQLSENLYVGYITVRTEEKPAALMTLINNVLKPGQQAIIFTCSRHHVEYLAEILTILGMSVSSIYGQMDASARKINLAKFAKKKAQILIVTDVAARGIDIPQLEVVINYDFPDKPKLFVHRVGRTARAGKSGAAYSILQPDELPYLLDLQLFLNSSNVQSTLNGQVNCVHGKIPGRYLSSEVEALQLLHKKHFVLDKMAQSAANAAKLYRSTKKAASSASINRAKELADENGDMKLPNHPVVAHLEQPGEEVLEEFLRTQIRAFRPAQNIFEIKHAKSGKDNPHSAMMAARRKQHSQIIEKVRKQKTAKRMEREAMTESRESKEGKEHDSDHDSDHDFDHDSDHGSEHEEAEVEQVVSKKRKRDASEESDDDSVSQSSKQPQKSKSSERPKKKIKVQETSWKDDKYFLSGISASTATDKGLSIKEAPQNIEDMILDLNPDDDRSIFKKKSIMTWDKKKRKYVQHEDTEAGKKQLKVRNEAGQLVIVGDKNRGKLYKEWVEKTHKSIPAIGDEDETAMPESNFYRHAKNMGGKTAQDYHAQRKGKHGGKAAAPKQEIKTKEQLIKMKAEQAKKAHNEQMKAKKSGGARFGKKGGKR